MKVGDLIDIVLDGRLYAMQAVKKLDHKTFLFIFENCLNTVHHMNEDRTSKYGYHCSEMKQFLHTLNDKVHDSFKEHYTLLPVDAPIGDETGNYFRLLTKDEIFGRNHYKYFDVDVVGDPVNTTAMFNNVDNISYWLQDPVDPDTFACVTPIGKLCNNYADFELGVRLACIVKDEPSIVVDHPNDEDHEESTTSDDIRVDGIVSRRYDATEELELIATGNKLAVGLTYQWNLLADGRTYCYMSNSPTLVLSRSIERELFGSLQLLVSLKIGDYLSPTFEGRETDGNPGVWMYLFFKRLYDHD